MVNESDASKSALKVRNKDPNYCNHVVSKVDPTQLAKISLSQNGTNSKQKFIQLEISNTRLSEIQFIYKKKKFNIPMWCGVFLLCRWTRVCHDRILIDAMNHRATSDHQWKQIEEVFTCRSILDATSEIRYPTFALHTHIFIYPLLYE